MGIFTSSSSSSSLDQPSTLPPTSLHSHQNNLLSRQPQQPLQQQHPLQQRSHHHQQLPIYSAFHTLSPSIPEVQSSSTAPRTLEPVNYSEQTGPSGVLGVGSDGRQRSFSDDSTVDQSASTSSVESFRGAISHRNTLRRPPPPPLTYTNSGTMGSSFKPPPLRQSQSFSVGDRATPPSPPKAQTSTNMDRPKRAADDIKPLAAVGRKKSGFSQFMNTMLGSPKRATAAPVEISKPSNYVHVTHVGFDFDTGQFTVRFATPKLSTRSLI
jgi:p21-activated kinase 1